MDLHVSDPNSPWPIKDRKFAYNLKFQGLLQEQREALLTAHYSSLCQNSGINFPPLFKTVPASSFLSPRTSHLKIF